MGSYVNRECVWCKQSFQALLKEVNRGKGQFCSVSCANSKRSEARGAKEARVLKHRALKKTDQGKYQAKAHRAVEAAIQQGKLVRAPCEVCGSKKAVHAHHDDYSKPLSVRWLCAKHHLQHHREQRQQLAAPATNNDVSRVRLLAIPSLRAALSLG